MIKEHSILWLLNEIPIVAVAMFYFIWMSIRVGGSWILIWLKKRSNAKDDKSKSRIRV